MPKTTFSSILFPRLARRQATDTTSVRRRSASRLLFLGLFGSLLSPGLAIAGPNEAIKVCTIDNPFFFSREGDAVRGLEYDILSSFSEQIDQPLEIIWLDPQEQKTEQEVLEECPIIAMTLTRTPERERNGAVFSDAYFPVRAMLVERSGETSKSIEELAGKKVATLGGTSHATFLDSLDQSFDVVLGSNPEEIFRWVAEGEVQATVYDSWAAAESLKQYENLKVSMALGEPQSFGFLFRESTPMVPQLDQHIRHIKQDGTMLKLLERNFGSELAEIIAEGLLLAEAD